MRSTRQLSLIVICGLGCIFPAAAQLDSSGLRAKYGMPLDRETFHMPAGFDLVVDYGANHQVCKLQAPALMPTTEKISNTTVMKQRMYGFLSDLVTGAIRGKELRQWASVMGTISLLSVEYEHVIINELQRGDQIFSDTITVTFKDCSPADQ